MNVNRILLILTFFIVSGCSDSVDKTANEPSKDEHVWKTQTDTIGKAKGIEQSIMDAANQQKNMINEQSR